MKTITLEAAKLLGLPHHWQGSDWIYQFRRGENGLELWYRSLRDRTWERIVSLTDDYDKMFAFKYERDGLPVLWEEEHAETKP